MARLQHDYLEYIGGNSNKFYVAIHLGDGDSLVGYGPRSGGASGTWARMPENKARGKIREKLKKGYVPSQISSMPKPALSEASRRHQGSCGEILSVDVSGDLISIGPQGAGPGPAPARPRIPPRPRGPNPLKAWF